MKQFETATIQKIRKCLHTQKHSTDIEFIRISTKQ